MAKGPGGTGGTKRVVWVYCSALVVRLVMPARQSTMLVIASASEKNWLAVAGGVADSSKQMMFVNWSVAALVTEPQLSVVFVLDSSTTSTLNVPSDTGVVGQFGWLWSRSGWLFTPSSGQRIPPNTRSVKPRHWS